jgi:predicted ATP-grasp superfamily ATP-dependent carboligase
MKPVSGSGGIGVTTLHLESEYNLNINYPVVIQEYIPSEAYSASFISSNFLCFNKQLISNNVYVGSISPHIPKVKNGTIEDFSSLIESLGLVGMNGIDFMVREDIPYIIEVNPRILGTFETIELSSKESLSKAILENKAVVPKEPYFKKVVFSNCSNNYFIEKNEFIHDVPKKGSFIEKGEPLATIIGKNMEKLRELECRITTKHSLHL